jgi:hypothetical protein
MPKREGTIVEGGKVLEVTEVTMTLMAEADGEATLMAGEVKMTAGMTAEMIAETAEEVNGGRKEGMSMTAGMSGKREAGLGGEVNVGNFGRSGKRELGQGEGVNVESEGMSANSEAGGGVSVANEGRIGGKIMIGGMIEDGMIEGGTIGTDREEVEETIGGTGQRNETNV